MKQARVEKLQQIILSWYGEHQRDLPWRRTRDPYAIWISEIMLQQTRVAQAGPYFQRFLRRFPDLGTLARARLDSVLKAWEGMGYYSRARNLHSAARQVVREHGGALPGGIEDLTALPGIGAYTAGAIASIAFGRDEPVVDGNVIRLYSRLFALEDDFSTAGARRKIWDRARELLPEGRASSFNQALMDLGATVCLPRNPLCSSCPLRAECRALSQGLVAELPRKAEKKTVPQVTMAMGVIVRKNRVLLSRRPAEGLLGGLWDFPSGKVKNGEGLEEGLMRILRETVGMETHTPSPLVTVKHAFTHFRLTLHAFINRDSRGRARALTVDSVKWVGIAELERYAVPTATRKVKDALYQHRLLGKISI